ncbi:MAG: hypothetical protein WCT54_04785, partial [Patescibacteria group bacterium]
MSQAFAKPLRASGGKTDIRFVVFSVGLILAGAICILRLGKLQVVDHKIYGVLASDQHDLETKLLPNRGRIFIKESNESQLYPLAANREAWTLYAVPKNMKDPIK